MVDPTILPVIRVERKTPADHMRDAARQIVCEEWQCAVREFGLPPGTVTELVTARILERIAALRPTCGE